MGKVCTVNIVRTRYPSTVASSFNRVVIVLGLRYYLARITTLQSSDSGQQRILVIGMVFLIGQQYAAFRGLPSRRREPIGFSLVPPWLHRSAYLDLPRVTLLCEAHALRRSRAGFGWGGPTSGRV